MGLITDTSARLAALTGLDPAAAHDFITAYSKELLRSAWHTLHRRRRRLAGYLVPTNGTATSQAAAMMMGNLGEVQQKVLAAVTSAGTTGATAQEIESATGLSGNSVRPRLRELEGAGMVHRTRATRATVSGRGAYVWFA